MPDPVVIPDKMPVALDLEPGTYWWCACGKSATQPWCDGSHAGSGHMPQPVEITEQRTYFLCQCKHTKGAPFCDGSHQQL